MRASLGFSSLSFFVVLSLIGTATAVGCGSTNDDPAAPPSSSPEAGPDARPLATEDAASGDDAAPDAPVDVPSVPVAGVCADSAQKICAFLGTCAPSAVDGFFAAAADCVPRFESICVGPYPANAAVRKDDADAFATCLGALTCDALYGPSWPTACAIPRLKATRPTGASCRMDAECDTGSCTGSSTQCGTCVKRQAPGTACTDRAQCPAAGYCSTVCYGAAFLGDTCDTYNLCGNGLKCTAGKCVKAGGAGATCTGDLDCDLPAVVACNGATMQCQAVTSAQPGDACPAAFAEGPPVSCVKGSSCIRPAAGQPGTCVAPAKVGEACDNQQRCESFINCRGGKCVLPTYVACP